MASLPDEAKESNEHLERVEELLKEIKDKAIGAVGKIPGLETGVGGFSAAKKTGQDILSDPKVDALISALRFLADKVANQSEAAAKLEAALSISARRTARETTAGIAESLARAGVTASPELLESVARRQLAIEQAGMAGRRAGAGAAERAFVGLGMSPEEAERVQREAAEQGFVSQQVMR